MEESKKVICPVCVVSVLPQPNFSADEEGDAEYDCTDCPICGYVFIPSELK